MRKRIKKFSNYILEERNNRGLSQEELAVLVGVNASTISRIENGSRKNLGYMLVLKLKIELDIKEPEDGFVF